MYRPHGALAATLALGAAGCSGGASGGKHSANSKEGGGNPAAANEGAAIGGTPRKGGTLTVLSNQDFEHLDPARNWVMNTMDFGTRLLYRTLVTYRAEPGGKGNELVPDLATDLGTPSADARTWTFHLKQGLKYEDGSPVTAQDVKYNVERSFSPGLPGGADYAARYLAGADGYRGPAEGRHLDSVKTPDDRTIVFELRKPFAEFPWATVMPTFAPVPRKQDKGPSTTTGRSPPARTRSSPTRAARSSSWSATSTGMRGPTGSARLVVVMGLKANQIDDRLIASQGAGLRRLLGNPLWYRHVLAWHRDGPLAGHGDEIVRTIGAGYLATCATSSAYARWRERHPMSAQLTD